QIVVQIGAEEPRVTNTETEANAYHFEMDMVARYVADRQAPSPAMSQDDSLGNMATLDAWRKEAGVVFAADLG
ncbi:MAG: oxidoreductase domain protein, partial [Pseudonocardiales bacterium]|nr:oxidoreductase domain protein [Pseudonocardiales bacterium]